MGSCPVDSIILAPNSKREKRANEKKNAIDPDIHLGACEAAARTQEQRKSEEKAPRLADQMNGIDPDEGVKVSEVLFAGVLVSIIMSMRRN